jgi:hypothetical protein
VRTRKVGLWELVWVKGLPAAAVDENVRWGVGLGVVWSRGLDKVQADFSSGCEETKLRTFTSLEEKA